MFRVWKSARSPEERTGWHISTLCLQPCMPYVDIVQCIGLFRGLMEVSPSANLVKTSTSRRRNRHSVRIIVELRLWPKWSLSNADSHKIHTNFETNPWQDFTRCPGTVNIRFESIRESIPSLRYSKRRYIGGRVFAGSLRVSRAITTSTTKGFVSWHRYPEDVRSRQDVGSQGWQRPAEQGSWRLDGNER